MRVRAMAGCAVVGEQIASGAHGVIVMAQRIQVHVVVFRQLYVALLAGACHVSSPGVFLCPAEAPGEIAKTWVKDQITQAEDDGGIEAP